MGMNSIQPYKTYSGHHRAKYVDLYQNRGERFHQSYRELETRQCALNTLSTLETRWPTSCLRRRGRMWSADRRIRSGKCVHPPIHSHIGGQHLSHSPDPHLDAQVAQRCCSVITAWHGNQQWDTLCKVSLPLPPLRSLMGLCCIILVISVITSIVSKFPLSTRSSLWPRCLHGDYNTLALAIPPHKSWISRETAKEVQPREESTWR